MTDRSLEAVARMLVTLAGVEEAEQCDVLAAVARVWCDRASPYRADDGHIRLWRQASEAAQR